MPTVLMWPLCLSPSISPPPLISKSSWAIKKPEPKADNLIIESNLSLAIFDKSGVGIKK